MIAGVLKKWREEGGHVVHVLHETPEGAPVFTRGTELEGEFDELPSREGDGARETVVRKTQPSAFTGTELGSVLEGWGKKAVLLVGGLGACFC